MRAPRALLLLLTIPACGDSSDTGSASFSSQPSDPTATTEAADTGHATTPTTTAQPTTGPTTGPASASATEATGTPTSSSDASDTSDPSAADTSTSAAASDGSTSTGAVSASDGSTSGSTGPACPEGQDGCPCGPGDSCDPGLMCAQGLCGPPAPKCGDGKQDPGEQCDDGNQVNGDGCEANCVKTPAQPKDACGNDGDGVWFQIDYSNAFTVSNPTYSYSPTPGWGEAQWAPAGKNWPYAVDLFNNAKVINDQIGTVALLDGTNKAVRVYFGLVGLNYTYATVCVEGRSYSVGSSVEFFVEEAKTKCGDYGMMANDWSIHATGVDLQDCFLPGDDFQAVQVQPSGGSGSLSLKRLRVTLHGASY
ncbi:hypothetical protein [Nannocystis sp.]|uniref:hypothetical protein n=1 Tax=Nannocystis sp. TaxID=1962667 RepID=UPI0025FC82C9|nr:hypothetical protein [Nannocystis sp.]